METRQAEGRAEDEDAPFPAILRGWLIEGELGRGGMGRVFRARHPKTRARAAIKVLLGDYARRPDVVARFRQEAIAVNIINHPGIVRVFDSGELEDGSPYIVMEYLDGRGLRDWVQAVPAADRPRQVVRLGYQIASAMAAAHASKVVHRDLKPENIMVIDDELAPGGSRVKILDFGIAKVLWGGLPEVLELDARGSIAPASVPTLRTELSAPTAPTVGMAPDPESAAGWAGIASGPASDARTTAESEESSTAESDPREDDALRSLPRVSLERPAIQTFPAPVEIPPGVVSAAAGRVSIEPAGPASSGGGAGQPTMPFTQEGAWGLGTRSYMAPEQERHSGSVDVKADVYSLGVILYELLEGQTPDAPRGAWPPPMSAATPPDLVALVHRVLSFDPDARPRMAEVATALHRLGRAKKELDEALSRWVASGRAPRLLPRGKALHELSAWARDIDDLSGLERSFLDAALGAEARRERLTRVLLALGVVFLMGMVATTTVFWVHATRARATAEAAERAAREHSRLEAAANSSAQEALAKMTEAQRATEEALALAMKASDDAKSANSARDSMTEAKRLAEGAELRARRAAQAAAAAKAEADERYEQSRSAMEREIAGLEGDRERLSARLGQAEDERERVRAALRSSEHELRAALSELRRESTRVGLLERRLDEASAQIDALERQNEECALRQRRARPQPEPPADGDMPPAKEEREEIATPPAEPPAEPKPRPAPRWRWRRDTTI
ncbi:Protein kinase [Sorangium cellulosum So ce56]|uniref:Protein kinase n=1 Tax=Sorangium cellulosum (strain So ce56) TaxID=448385 RepID=A9G3H0_SORC5|nr:serine/threonine-protein kinase [Sorangium cellulosum]CAN95761.1 Protein kinase [Sorangium cellulosum So ce56]